MSKSPCPGANDASNSAATSPITLTATSAAIPGGGNLSTAAGSVAEAFKNSKPEFRQAAVGVVGDLGALARETGGGSAECMDRLQRTLKSTALLIDANVAGVEQQLEYARDGVKRLSRRVESIEDR
ncbi:hypothetical protein EV182_002709 [Spiromyces aspiralis]|uniref:Uncharacterized protein n=1 Tax=Spiromyces aspiralis TaxID=68401 RepID=A0ACC1HRD1_9FUNG|nr:hypothetical protein EV182_002709 [Spiromyces aspiralis]